MNLFERWLLSLAVFLRTLYESKFVCRTELSPETFLAHLESRSVLLEALFPLNRTAALFPRHSSALSISLCTLSISSDMAEIAKVRYFSGDLWQASPRGETYSPLLLPSSIEVSVNLEVVPLCTYLLV